ncbi:MAG: retron St85 family RNA-directed DNA polymerase [Proteobacteria bacterium]|nr:retron St85 family RNA-directed DNA polymerase [Pseudomonadota bacterium]
MLLEKLQIQSNQSLERLERFATSASKRYKVFQIPKRSGGFRIIEQPSKEIKAIQRWLIEALFDEFPIHHSATAYIRGKNIRSNAEVHAESNFTLKLDFENFFPSFTERHLIKFLRNYPLIEKKQINDRDINFISRICLRNGRLTIGAPSSPTITNAMMYQFDTLMSARCAEDNFSYTRYADDVFVSSRSYINVGEIILFVENLLSKYEYASLRLNKDKTAILSRKGRRSITGCVITPQRGISIGRKLKKSIKHKIYESINGRLSSLEATKLMGYLGFLKDIEPNYFESLKKKYGADAIKTITSGNYDEIKLVPLILDDLDDTPF